MDRVCRLIVLESQGNWVAALRKLASIEGIAREVRTVTEAEAELSAAPASFIVTELLAPSASALIERIEIWGRQYPLARVAVVTDRAHAAWLALAREAGAIYVAKSPAQLQPLLAAFFRHVKSHPQPPASAAERIWSDLPLSTGSLSPNPQILK